MIQERESRPGGESWTAGISSAGDTDSRIPQSTPNLREVVLRSDLDDDRPFGSSLYADVPDMSAFIRCTVRQARSASRRQILYCLHGRGLPPLIRVLERLLKNLAVHAGFSDSPRYRSRSARDTRILPPRRSTRHGNVPLRTIS